MRVWIEIKAAQELAIKIKFHPLMRVWIEICCGSCFKEIGKFHPLMRVWIEIFVISSLGPKLYVSPSYEGVD